MNTDSLEFKKALANFASSVCVVSTVFEEKMHAVTISSFAALSLDPPMIIFCLGKNSNKYQYFVTTKMIAISILNEEQKDLSDNFSRNHPNYWENINITIGPFSKCPLIKDSLSFFECIVENQYEGGDHTIFIAKVINYGKSNDLKPLIHFKSNYWKIN